jgi:hypothetical protein
VIICQGKNTINLQKVGILTNGYLEWWTMEVGFNFEHLFSCVMFLVGLTKDGIAK